MDGTLEQQIQKLKIYQVKIVNFAANFSTIRPINDFIF